MKSNEFSKKKAPGRGEPRGGTRRPTVDPRREKKGEKKTQNDEKENEEREKTRTLLSRGLISVEQPLNFHLDGIRETAAVEEFCQRKRERERARKSHRSNHVSDRPASVESNSSRLSWGYINQKSVTLHQHL